MNQIIRNTNPLFAPLLQELENQEFIKLFAEDPYTALEKVGIEMDLAEFTAYLSQDRDLYDSIIKKSLLKWMLQVWIYLQVLVVVKINYSD